MNDRQRQIIATATALFLDKGVGVSTASIARAAGVSNGTLFNAFPNKQALIDAIYLEAKRGMFAALPHSGTDPFDRAHLRANWQGYLDWARANPQARQIMHFLLEAGLAGPKTQAEIATLGAPYEVWMQAALDKGIIRAPNVAFVASLVFFHLDLVLNHDLDPPNTDLAFEMFCTSIGLTT